MEREILATGIGGQGVQLATRTLAEASMLDGRRVQMFSSYGGMMRGGNSDAMLVVGDGPITAPPVLASAWAALVLHHEHAGAVWGGLESDGLAIVNSSVVDQSAVPADLDATLIELPALDMATDLGAPVAASLVMAGALVAHTGLVSEQSLLATAERVLPSYRAEAAEVNRQALQAGLTVSTSVTCSAWTEPVVAEGSR